MAVGFLTSAVPFSATGGFGTDQSAAFDSGATGEDRLLAVAIFYENGGDPAISGITYNGVALTKQIEETVSPTDDFSETVEIWTLVAPATGSNTLALTNTATAQDANIQAAVYTGVDQTNPVSATNSIARQLSDDGTFSLTLLADGGAFWALVQDRGGDSNFTAATDNTKREQSTLGGSGSGFVSAIGDRLVGSGSVTVGATQTFVGGGDNTQDLAGAGIALAPVSGTVSVGLATETSTALPLAVDRTVAVGLATETDAANAVTITRALSVGLAAETDTANTVTVTTGAKTVQVATAREISTAPRLNSGLSPFWWQPHDESEGQPAKRKLRPLVFEDGDDGQHYIIMRNENDNLMHLEAFAPKFYDEVYSSLGGPILESDGELYRVYVSGGVLRFERSLFHVRTRPVLFGRVARPKARDPRYELVLPVPEP